MSFLNQTAIVTGAGQGIGFAIAEGLCQQGANVLLNDLDETLCFEAAERIRQGGGRCEALPGDAAEVLFIQQLVDTAVDRFGGVDLVVANAGLTLFGDFFSYDPTHFERVLNLNLRGSFFLTQAAARQMREQGRGGSVLLMSSVVGHQAHPGLAAYAMTKAALEMLAKNLVLDLSPYGITINALAPGATQTERTLDDPDYVPIWSRITPMGRPATVADMTHAALFLLNPASRHITGQSLVVDGGWTSVSPPPNP
ncbi:SDR family NAD(P)-dependent oxidoreductase [Rudanella lutea]|jgi:3-oxoacyl-[acyl-carrier protein] reductase|uniref:SDR family NAD(P)-dependent oxidoreductase n=1 Tax=Rudanella lutea TaxID=451374 RepID=UPI000366D42D|nr:SDR family oxidoreductase [Rudanella lutea]